MPQHEARRNELWRFAILLTAAAFLLRWRQFGNPVIDVDEQFYLLVGDRLLHGALPYVDIWDRKPFGLFALYAGIRLLGGNGIVQYQIVATLFAAATAIIIAIIGYRIGSRLAALCGGIVYLLWLNWFGGDGGQTPVFYNAFVAAAALIVLAASRPGIAPRRRRALGCGAMLLIGLALQIKYSCIFEGVFFGLALLYAARRDDESIAAIAVSAGCWMAVAAAPTLAVWAAYAAFGHGQAFAYANFVSIFNRIEEPAGELRGRLGGIVAETLILTLPALGALWLHPMVNEEEKRTYRFAWGWFVASWIGLLTFGSYYLHYALPLLVPTAVVLIPALSLSILGPLLALVAIVTGLVGSEYRISRSIAARGGKADIARLVADVRQSQRGGCLYVYDGDSILYHLTHACFLTRYVFPTHLNSIKEAHALGLNSAAELRRVLAAKPAVIVSWWPHDALRAPSHNAIVDAVLARDYRLVDAVRIGHRWERVYAVKRDTRGREP